MSYMDLPKLDRRRWRSIVLAALLTTFLRVMLQPMIPEGESQVPPSILVDAGLLIPAFVIYALVSYMIIAYAFALVEGGLPWSKLQKGTAFGALFGMIWVAYLFEPVPLGEGTPFLEMLAYPLVDGFSMLVLGVLLGVFVATEPRTARDGTDRKTMVLVLIPIVMLTIRLFEYNVLHIYSSYEGRPLETILWTLGTGLCIAIAYMFLRTGVPSGVPSGRALTFGILIYGLPITFVNFFVVLALKIDVTDMALRSTMDTLAVIVGIYLVERSLLLEGRSVKYA